MQPGLMAFRRQRKTIKVTYENIYSMADSSILLLAFGTPRTCSLSLGMGINVAFSPYRHNNRRRLCSSHRHNLFAFENSSCTEINRCHCPVCFCSYSVFHPSGEFFCLVSLQFDAFFGTVLFVHTIVSMCIGEYSL